MITPFALRSSSYSGVETARSDPTTGRGLDKKAHIAPRLIGCFFGVFWSLPHIGLIFGNVRRKPKVLYLRDLSHITERRHGR